MKLKKHIVLLLTSTLILFSFFLLPRNHSWITERVVPYWQDFQSQKNDLDIEHRKVRRYNGSYTYSKQIADFFRLKGIHKEVLVLVPPSAYFKKNGIDYPVPEPAVFYYFTGLKTVWVNSKEAVKANWLIRADHGRILFDSIYDGRILIDTIKDFKKFPVSL